MATAKAKTAVFEDWVRARCVVQAGVSTLHDELYRDYVRFVDHPLDPPHALKPQAFARAMEAAGFTVLKRPEGRYRQGLRLKPSPSAEDAIATATIIAPKMRVDELVAREVSGREVLSSDIAVHMDRFRKPAEQPPLWRFASIKAGEPEEVGLVLEVDGAGAEASARIARELFLERRREVTDENFSAAHDDAYRNGELQRAASAYAYGAAVKAEDANWLRTDAKLPRPPGMYHIVETLRSLWPWDLRWWKPTDPRRMLVKAGALIIAAIEAIDRKAARGEWKGEG